MDLPVEFEAVVKPTPHALVDKIRFFEGSCGADSKNGFWPAKSALSEIIIIKNQLVID